MRFKNVASSTGEDFIEDLISSITIGEANKVMKKVKEKAELDNDSYVDEAIESALQTFQFGITQIVILTVSQYALTKSTVLLLGIISYVKGRSVVKKAKTFSQKLFQKVGKHGGVVGKVIKGAFGAIIGSQEETLAIAKMTNDTGNNLITAVGQERNNQIHLRGQKLERIHQSKNNLFKTTNSLMNTASKEDMILYIQKFEMGTWNKTTKDKNLYFNCTGQDKTSVNFTKDFTENLNKYSKYVKTARGEVFSNAKATLEMITALGTNVKD